MTKCKVEPHLLDTPDSDPFWFPTESPISSSPVQAAPQHWLKHKVDFEWEWKQHVTAASKTIKIPGHNYRDRWSVVNDWMGENTCMTRNAAWLGDLNIWWTWAMKWCIEIYSFNLPNCCSVVAVCRSHHKWRNPPLITNNYMFLNRVKVLLECCLL
jgi:hypothetical protein